MKQNLLLAALFSSLVFAAIFLKDLKISPPVQVPSDAFSAEGKKGQRSRKEWQTKMLRDPATGKIPSGIRGKEIAFSKTLPMDNGWAKTPNQQAFTLQGPFNLGGRTRALAIDVTNENVIFAGSVSGGLWRSENAGNSWTEVTTPSQHLGVTAISQDRRPGKENNWYFSTGEAYGTSASGGEAFFLGDGMFKSTNGGLSWNPIDATDNGNPQSFTINWQVIWNIATHPSDSDTIVFAAAYGAIYRTLNGGATWLSMLGGSSYFTDVAVTSKGTAYATLSSDGLKKGIWRSANGYSAFTNITPTNWINGTDTLKWPIVYDRNVIGIDPNDENSVYFFASTPGYGKASTDFQGDTEWVSLWKYQYLSGDGSGAGGLWTDLSENLPYDGSIFGNIVVQGSYDMYIRVMPGNSNIVFLGATNLYRSTDGFSSANNTSQLGGYGVGAGMPFFTTYPNHHPDQHNLAFLPSNPDVVISATDGGLYKTTDCLAPNVVWESLNTGYHTTQWYTIAVDHGTAGSNIVTGGLQDWGSWWTNSANPLDTWTFPSTGDGSFCAIADGGGTYYYSRQSSILMKATLDSNGSITAFRRFDPIGVEKNNFMFINPFVLDPTDNNILYLPEGENLWRNNTLSQITLDGSWDTISTGWSKYSFSLADSNANITALTASKNGSPHRLYFGTDNRKIYKMDSAHTGDPAPIEITSTAMPANAYVSCIAVDPRDGDKVMVVFSNYNVYSIFYSENAGAAWKKVAGNLEQNSSGSGNGPSCRWASILPKGDSTLFLIGTSTGLYATDTLVDNSTVWVQQGSNTIGNVVVTMMDVRESDGFIAVATHGNGVFTNHLPFSFSVTNSSNCTNLCDGSASATINGGVSPYSFSWSATAGNQSGATATGLCPGNYSVTVTDANNASGVGNTAVFSTILSTTNVVNAKTSTSATGSATVSVSGGLTPYTYLWNSGQTSSSIDSLLPGTYTVTVSDLAGCNTTSSAFVGVYLNFLDLSLSVNNVSDCNSPCDGSATTSTSGGTTPYSFQWDAAAGNQTSSYATGLCQGSYSVSVYDAVGYYGVGNVSVLSNIVADIIVGNAQDSTSATGYLIVSPSGGTSPYTFLWDNGQTTSYLSNITPGTYNVTVTDNNGCIKSVQAIVGQWVTGIAEDNYSGEDFLIYPNPVAETLALNFSNSGTVKKEAEVKIFDASGKLVFSSSIPENLSLKVDVSQLSAGVYYFTLITENKRISKKILIIGK